MEPLYEYTWRNKWLTAHCKTLDEMISALREHADCLEKMKTAGVELSEDSVMEDDYAILITEDEAIAAEFGFEEIDEEDFE